MDKIDIAGMEMKRSDSPQLTRELQEKVFEMILKGRGYEDVKEFLPGVLKKYRAGGYSYVECGIPSGINKNLQDYANLDAHGRGAMYANEHFKTKFNKGSKPKRLYVKRSLMPDEYPNTDVICFEYPEQIPDGVFEIDWETMLEKTIRAPLERIFDALGWCWDDFDPKVAKKTTLDMFF